MKNIKNLKLKKIKMKGNKAITLVTLVITVIILLILAGITINTLSNSGLFEKAKEARDKWQNAQDEEEMQIAKYSNEIENYIFEYARNNDESNIPSNRLELIGLNMGNEINIPVGYKYVIISNSVYGGNSNTFETITELTKLSSNTNSQIINNQNSGDYSASSRSSTTLIFAQINDSTQITNFTMNGSDYNIVLGIK